MATLLRFVWCAFLLCRAGVHARRNLCGIAPAWILCCESRSVGAACMRPVGDCLTIPSFDCGGVRSMRRGGIHAARETVRALSVTGSARRVPCLVGRAFYLRPKSRRCAAVGHLRAKSRALRPGCAPKRRCGASPKRACGRSARRTDTIFKNVQCAAGVNARPTNRREQAIFPQTPRVEHPCREACMPPLQTPGTAYTNQKRCHRANVPGPHACGPYEPPGKRMFAK